MRADSTTTQTISAVAAGSTADQSADRIIRDAECERLSGLSRTTRWRLERRDRFPKRRQLSDNAVGWLLSEVLAWRSSRPTAATAEAA